MSTDGSDEDWLHPGPTLSFDIARFWPSGPIIDNLVMSYRSNGHKTVYTGLHAPRSSREWLNSEPYGQSDPRWSSAGTGYGRAGAGWVYPGWTGWVSIREALDQYIGVLDPVYGSLKPV